MDVLQGGLASVGDGLSGGLSVLGLGKSKAKSDGGHGERLSSVLEHTGVLVSKRKNAASVAYLEYRGAGHTSMDSTTNEIAHKANVMRMKNAIMKGNFPSVWSRINAYVCVVVASVSYQMFIVAVTMASITAVGVVADLDSVGNEDPSSPLAIFETSVLAIFLMDMSLQLHIHRLSYFSSPFNLVDIGCNAMNVADIVIVRSGQADNFGLFLHLLTSLRAVRVIKVFAYLPKLRALATAFALALQDCASVFVLLVIALYIFAILANTWFGSSASFRRTVVDRYGDCCGADPKNEFGTVTTGMFSLFQILSGDSWMSQIARPICDAAPLGWALFLFFWLFVAVAMNEMFTSVFIDSLLLHSMDDSDKDRYFNRELIVAEVQDLTAEMFEVLGPDKPIRQWATNSENSSCGVSSEALFDLLHEFETICTNEPKTLKAMEKELASFHDTINVPNGGKGLQPQSLESLKMLIQPGADADSTNMFQGVPSVTDALGNVPSLGSVPSLGNTPSFSIGRPADETTTEPDEKEVEEPASDDPDDVSPDEMHYRARLRALVHFAELQRLGHEFAYVSELAALRLQGSATVTLGDFQEVILGVSNPDSSDVTLRDTLEIAAKTVAAEHEANLFLKKFNTQYKELCSLLKLEEIKEVPKIVKTEGLASLEEKHVGKGTSL